MAAGLRQDTAHLKYNPLASPEAKSMYKTPEKTHGNFGRQTFITTQATSPNMLSDWDIYKNMKGDPYLRYLHNSQNKYQHRNTDLPHDLHDAIQVPKLPG